ncbi:MAG: hypothetical protein AAF570_21150 [Bacteroidota bacterium]
MDALKLEAIQLLGGVRDEAVLNSVLEMLRKATNAEVLGSTPDGKPYTRADLIADLEEAEADMAAGRVYTTAEVRARLTKRYT